MAFRESKHLRNSSSSATVWDGAAVRAAAADSPSCGAQPERWNLDDKGVQLINDTLMVTRLQTKDDLTWHNARPWTSAQAFASAACVSFASEYFLCRVVLYAAARSNRPQQIDLGEAHTRQRCSEKQTHARTPHRQRRQGKAD